jgi:phosphoribosylformylglycinamidine cyclo-ligase
MGHRMEIYCEEANAQSIIAIAQSFNIDAKIIGRCESAAQPSLVINGPYGEFQY